VQTLQQANSRLPVRNSQEEDTGLCFPNRHN
jgi:hypothetical protein